MKLSFRKLLSQILNLNTVSNLVLSSLKEDKIREFYGTDFLSPVQQFALHGYNSLLYQDLNINKSGVIVVLGGYLGDSASNYYQALGCQVHVYEPVVEYFDSLQARFKHNLDIQIHNEAISSCEKSVSLSINGEETGMYQHGKQKLTVIAKDIFQVVDNLGHIDLLEINVEGAEYEILERLISSKKIVNINILQIQFHNFSNQHELERARIRASLAQTHLKIFSYDWVWERWELKCKTDVLVRA